jgi:hypothetical protein
MYSKTKEGLLNDVIGMTKRTGQGLPQFVIDKGGWQYIADELVEEGHLAIYGRNTNDPVTTWYCYTKCYNVEKDTTDFRGTMLYYSFMRHYLRIAEDESKGKLPSNAEVVNHNMDEYKKWLIENLEGLEAIKSLEDVSIGTELLDEHIEYLKERDWYKKNLTIKEALKELEEGTDNLEEIIPQTKKIVRMMEGKSEYKEEMEKYEENLVEYSAELKTRKKLYSIMDGLDSDTKIQDGFSKYTEKV